MLEIRGGSAGKAGKAGRGGNRVGWCLRQAQDVRRGMGAGTTAEVQWDVDRLGEARSGAEKKNYRSASTVVCCDRRARSNVSAELGRWRISPHS